jgi:hypothetical protein
MITPVEDAACGEADKPSGGGQDSRQGIVKKKQETIFEISIGFQHYFRIILKIRFGIHLFFRTIPKPLRQHPIKKKTIHLVGS